MKDLFLAVKEHLLQKEDLVIAAVIESRGSVPQGPGAKMLTGKGGRIWGTIGGAISEYLAIEESKRLLSGEKQSVRREYILRPNEAADIGAKCGGEFSAYLCYLDSGDPLLLPFIEEVIASFSLGEPVWLFILIGGEHGAAMGLAGGASAWFGEPSLSGEEAAGLCRDEPCLARAGGSLWFAEPLFPPGFVYIFGGGHVAQALAPLLAGLDFRCVIFDDRSEYTAKELYSGMKTITADFSEIGSRITLTGRDYVVVVTRGHLWDVQAEAFALRSGARYIGVIGSASKHEFVRGRLAEMGFSPEEIRAPRIHAPIGVPIGSRTPSEIAVSIAAELIRERSGAR